MTAHCIYLLVLLVACTVVTPQKILLMPFPYKSHVAELVEIAQTLIPRGYDVHILLSQSYPDIDAFKKRSNFTLMTYEIFERDWYSMPDMEELFEECVDMSSFIEDLRTHIDGFEQFCTNPLRDQKLLENIKKEHFDLALVDAFPNSRCYLVLLYKLGIPYVTVTTQYEPWLFRNPALPSVVPFPLYNPPLTSNMTFIERLKNTWALLDWSSNPGVSYLDDSLVTQYAPEMPPVTLDWLAGRSLLWLFDTDVVIDYPRATMPNEVNIGGLSARPSRPLPKDLETFVNGAKHGVIVASFGSMSAIPLKYMPLFWEAFERLDQRIVWRYADEPPEKIPNNIKLVKWLPQNDILGHPNVKLFMTHCGANGQFEALYHGVPMLSFPVFGDQPYNAKRTEYHGFALTVLLNNITSQEIVDKAQRIIGDANYAKRIKHASAIFKSRPLKPRDRASFWIDHVMKYGGDHLHSHALDMPWYQYLMLDILGLVLVVLLGFIWLLCNTVSFVRKSLTHKRTVVQHENNNKKIN